jgi:hypothetical protein
MASPVFALNRIHTFVPEIVVRKLCSRADRLDQAVMKYAFNSTSRSARLQSLRTTISGTNVCIRFIHIIKPCLSRHDMQSMLDTFVNHIHSHGIAGVCFEPGLIPVLIRL